MNSKPIVCRLTYFFFSFVTRSISFPIDCSRSAHAPLSLTSAVFVSDPFCLCFRLVIADLPSLSLLTFAAQYAAIIRVQPPREEIIADLRDMTAVSGPFFICDQTCILSCRKQFLSLDRRIKCRRESFSSRMESLRGGIKEFLSWKSGGLKVCFLKSFDWIFFLIVGTEAMLQGPISSGQVPTSTVLCCWKAVCLLSFSGLTSPIAHDFYLQSHAGILGRTWSFSPPFLD